MNNEEYKDITYEVKESKASNKILKKYSGKKIRKRLLIVITILFFLIASFSFYYILKNTNILSLYKNTSNIVVNKKIDKYINVIYDNKVNSTHSIEIIKNTDNKYLNSNDIDYYRQYYLIGDEKDLSFILVKFKKNTTFILNDYILQNKNDLVSNNNISSYIEDIKSSYTLISYSQTYDFQSISTNEFIKYKNRKLYILISDNYNLEYSKRMFDVFVNSN